MGASETLPQRFWGGIAFPLPPQTQLTGHGRSLHAVMKRPSLRYGDEGLLRIGSAVAGGEPASTRVQSRALYHAELHRRSRVLFCFELLPPLLLLQPVTATDFIDSRLRHGPLGRFAGEDTGLAEHGRQ